MKAAVLQRFGGADVLGVVDWPEPQPGPGEVLVEVHAVTTASFDVTLRSRGDALGLELPRVLGQDPTGVVAALGPGVEDYAIGDRVAAGGVASCGECDLCRAGSSYCSRHSGLGLHRDGGHAELVAVPTSTLVRLPDRITFAQAASMALTYPVAWTQLVTVAGLRAGETVLVMGAAGGLGLAAVHVAAANGATVVAAAGADWKLQRLREIPGVSAVVDYSTPAWTGEVARVTGGRGVDVVAENIGDPVLFSAALSCLAHDGRLVTSGAHGGGTVPVDIRSLYLRRHSILGSNAFTPEATEAVWSAVEQRRLEPPPPGNRLPLEQIADAHRLIERRESFGRVLLDVRDDPAGMD